MTKAFVTFISCFVIVGLSLVVFFPVSSDVMGLESQPALITHTNYTVQEIDGCEYILYRVYVDGSSRSYRKYECRMIHKANCQNHKLGL